MSTYNKSTINTIVLYILYIYLKKKKKLWETYLCKGIQCFLSTYFGICGASLSNQMINYNIAITEKTTFVSNIHT